MFLQNTTNHAIEVHLDVVEAVLEVKGDKTNTDVAHQVVTGVGDNVMGLDIFKEVVAVAVAGAVAVVVVVDTQTHRDFKDKTHKIIITIITITAVIMVVV